ncbi:MAG: SDR family oxidoreductase [Candidatus Aminicenantes bacterium]|nr:MAG: SDR family oxidoreductase [Candidatus Aminicenantes bacterium]
MSIKTRILNLVSLEGKIAIITGAASGIGLGTAKRLAEAGACAALFDIDESGGEKAVMEIKNLGGVAKFYRCDVTSSTDCKKVTEDVMQDFNRIDILFNNAGIVLRKNIIDLSEEEWDRVLKINLKAIYLLSHHVIPHMIKNGRGSIINTGSGWGLKGGPNAAAYCASKGGVVNLTRAMAIDHGKDNIRVNCICPGDIDTPLLHGEAAQLGEDEAKFLEEAADRPLGRVGVPEDIANAVLYFASDMSSWVTGSVLVVDGGGLA